MHKKTILEGIWAGEVTTTQSRFSGEIMRLLKLMFPLKMICLRANSAVASSRIIPEEIELLPALSLGDIMAEELSMEVPFGSMVVILKEQNRKGGMRQSDVSYQLGLIIGDMLLDIIGDSVFPLEYETKALKVMVNSYCLLVEDLENQNQKICSASFHKGISCSVSEYWNGPAQTPSNSNGNVTKEMVLFGGYLSIPNRYAWARKPSQKRVNLAQINGNLSSASAWKSDIVEAVLSEVFSDNNQVYNH